MSESGACASTQDADFNLRLLYAQRKREACQSLHTESPSDMKAHNDFCFICYVDAHMKSYTPRTGDIVTSTRAMQLYSAYKRDIAALDRSDNLEIMVNDIYLSYQKNIAPSVKFDWTRGSIRVHIREAKLTLFAVSDSIHTTINMYKKIGNMVCVKGPDGEETVDKDVAAVHANYLRLLYSGVNVMTRLEGERNSARKKTTN